MADLSERVGRHKVMSDQAKLRARRTRLPKAASTPALRIEPERRINGSIAHYLGTAIVVGEYRPGDLFPGEIEASENLGVSRTAYREAVRTLMAKGLVESRPKTGTRVSDRRKWHLLDPDVLAWVFAGTPDHGFLRNLFEMRMIVEPAAAALAAERRTGGELARMGHALEEMARHGLATAEGQVADQRFHSLILDASRNEMLMALTSTIGGAVHWTTLYKQRNHALPRDPIPDHRVLFEAIADADAGAARLAMTQLVELALQDTQMSLDA